MENIPRISWLSSTVNLEGNYGRLYFSTNPKVVLECSLFKPKVLRRSLMYDIVYISNLPTFCFLSLWCSGTIHQPCLFQPFVDFQVKWCVKWCRRTTRNGKGPISSGFSWEVICMWWRRRTFLGVSGSFWVHLRQPGMVKLPGVTWAPGAGEY